jgi:Spy/CpxP family protein refolding chaperone
MRKFLIPLALVSTALAAAPAMAQGYGPRGPEQTYNRDGGYDHRGDRDGGFNGGGSRQAVFELSRDLDRIDARIERGMQRGTLSRREAFGLRRDAQQIRFQLRRSGRDGLGGRELGQLRYQVARLEQRLRSERNDRDGRRF